MTKGIFSATIIILALAIIPACDKTGSGNNYLDQADCTGVDAAQNTYTKTVKAILDSECASSGCHDAVYQRSGVDLSTYAKAKNAFQNTNCLCTIHHGSECKPMPDGGAKLSDATIQKIDCWAKNGYAE